MPASTTDLQTKLFDNTRFQIAVKVKFRAEKQAMFRKYNFEQSPEMKSLKASPVFRIEAALPKIHTPGLHGYYYNFSH